MAKLNFLVNNKIEIIVDDNYYKSNIQDVEDGGVWISIPTSKGEYVPLRLGEVVDCVYYYNEDIYKFRTVVKGRSSNGIPTIKLETPQNITKIQRRNYVRIPYLKEIQYLNLKDRLLTISNTSSYKYVDFDKAILVDISGGGMKIKTTGQINLKDYLLINLKLEENIPIVTQIVRIEKDSEGRFICGLAFVEIDKLDREQIIKFVFKIMREQMKKI